LLKPVPVPRETQTRENLDKNLFEEERLGREGEFKTLPD